MRIDPRYADAHRNLAAALHAAGSSEEAIRHYRDAVRLSPDFAEAYFDLANVLAVSGRFEESVAALKATLRADPNHAKARHLLRTLPKQVQHHGPAGDPARVPAPAGAR